MIVNSNTFNNNQHEQVLSISNKQDKNSQTYKQWPYYPAKNNPGYAVRWSGQFLGTNAEITSISYDGFRAKSDVQDGINILKSVKY